MQWVALRLEASGRQREFFSEACAHFRQYSREELRTTQDGLKLAGRDALSSSETSPGQAAEGYICEFLHHTLQ